MLAITSVVISRLYCRLPITEVRCPLSAPLPGEFRTSSDLRRQTIKEQPGDRSLSSADMQRSHSEHQCHRHNGVSDVAETGGLFFISELHCGRNFG